MHTISSVYFTVSAFPSPLGCQQHFSLFSMYTLISLFNQLLIVLLIWFPLRKEIIKHKRLKSILKKFTSSQNFRMYPYLEIRSSQLRYKMRSHWIEEVPKFHAWWPYKKRKHRGTQRDMQRRRPCKDRGRGWSCKQRVPAIPGAPRHGKEPERILPREHSQKAHTTNTMISDFPTPGERVNVCCFKSPNQVVIY